MAGGAPFDRIQDSMFNVITSQFGYRAEWTPVAIVGPLQKAKVLYKEPTKTFNIMTIDFQITDESMEYKAGSFVDLFKMANDTNNTETVTIYFDNDTAVQYYVRQVVKKYDGKTYVAKLEPVN